MDIPQQSRIIIALKMAEKQASAPTLNGDGGEPY
jgi:hypothetical protein